MDLDLQTYARLLQTITSKVLIKQGKPLHLLFLKRGVYPSSITLSNRLLQMYTRCDHMNDARKLFDEMPQRNCFTWNSIIEGYVKSRNTQESLHLFHAMSHKNTFSWNIIISGLVKAANLNLARKLFDEMPMKNEVAWNSMIHGYAQNGLSKEAISLFKDLKSDSQGPCHVDIHILATVFGACTDLLALKLGKIIHGYIILHGLKFDPVLESSIVNMYGKCGDLDSASLVLHSLPYPDDFSLSSLITAYSNKGKLTNAKKIFSINNNPSVSLYNSLISGYIFNNNPTEALQLFTEMRRHGIKEDISTLATILSACDLVYVTQIHAHICKFGATHDLIVASVLVDTYTKCGNPNSACKLFNELTTDHDTILLNSMISVYCSCGRIKDAKRVFQSIQSKTLISWNSIISGLAQNGYPSEALIYFRELNTNTFKIDRFTLGSVISICAMISSLELGEQMFCKAIVIGLESDKIVSTSLVDFYCKCGFLEKGRNLFDQMVEPDEASWNSMLMGYATNGYGVEALNLFSEMRNCNISPTNITFTAVLSACDHCGLFEEGLKWFNAMKDDFFIDPGIEHYSCMIDLFARVGRLEEAMDLIVSMPFRADVSMWSAVLRGCLAYGDRILGKKVAEKMIGIDSKNADAYVQLASIFATSGDWGGSAHVRNLMIDKRIQKVPGTSWVDS